MVVYCGGRCKQISVSSSTAWSTEQVQASQDYMARTCLKTNSQQLSSRMLVCHVESSWFENSVPEKLTSSIKMEELIVKRIIFFDSFFPIFNSVSKRKQVFSLAFSISDSITG